MCEVLTLDLETAKLQVEELNEELSECKVCPIVMSNMH
jgi:hypothetical protein